MKFITKLFQRPDSKEKTVSIEFVYLQSTLEYYVIEDVRRELSAALVKDLFPMVKNKIMEDKHFQKIINEINLLLAKDFLK